MSNKRIHSHSFPRAGLLAIVLGCAAVTQAQQPIATGFDSPAGMGTSYSRHMIVPQQGTGDHDGSIELLTPWGQRFPLVSGLPSAVPPQDAVSGPNAVVATLSTVYVLIGEGDAMGVSPPPAQVPNPDGVSSPIFSSLLEMQFDPVPDGIREGFVLQPEDIDRLADGYTVHLENDSLEQVWIRVLTDFRDFVPDPVASVRQSNPFSLVRVGGLLPEDYDELAIPGASEAGMDFFAQLMPESQLGERLRERTTLYVVDSGRNAVHAVDALHGRSRILTRFPPVANPLFPTLGGPVVEAVPFGIEERNGKLLVSLFTGFPFAAGVSSIVEVDPASGTWEPVIEGLNLTGEMVVDGDDLYVVEFSSNLLEGAPGRLLRFSGGSTTPETVAAPLIGPVGLVQAGDAGDLFVSEIFTGTVKRIVP